MKVLLLGGPFDWRTMMLPKGHVGSIYLPLPIEIMDYALGRHLGPDEPSYEPHDHLRVAEYVSGEDIVTHDLVAEKPVYCGRIYNHLATR